MAELIGSIIGILIFKASGLEGEGYISKTVINKGYGINQKVASFFANLTDNRTIIAYGRTVQIAIIRDHVINNSMINPLAAKSEILFPIPCVKCSETMKMPRIYLTRSV